MNGKGPKPLKSGPKAFDVFQPGKTGASPTSRPVIVDRTPPVPDTTMTDSPSHVVHAPVKHELMDTSEKVTIQPPAHEDKAPEAPAPVKKVAMPVPPPAEEKPASEAPSSPEPEAPMRPLTEASNAEPKAAPVAPAENHPIVPGMSTPAEVEKVAPEEAPSSPDAIADPSQIVISHHAGPRGRHSWLKILLILLLVVVIAVVALDILLDAGVLKTSLAIPHTHFLK